MEDEPPVALEPPPTAATTKAEESDAEDLTVGCRVRVKSTYKNHKNAGLKDHVGEVVEPGSRKGLFLVRFPDYNNGEQIVMNIKSLIKLPGVP